MDIKSISRAQFDSLLPANVLLEPVIGQEIEWFADDAKTMLGTVADGHLFEPWVSILLASRGMDGFHIVRIEFGVPTHDEATVRLLRAMKASGSN